MLFSRIISVVIIRLLFLLSLYSSPIDFVRAKNLCYVYGNVTDALTSNSIEGTTILFWNDEKGLVAVVNTDSSGSYEAHLSSGFYKEYAYCNGGF